MSKQEMYIRFLLDILISTDYKMSLATVKEEEKIIEIENWLNSLGD